MCIMQLYFAGQGQITLECIQLLNTDYIPLKKKLIK